MYHMLPLVDYEATSAGFFLFNFPQDNQSWAPDVIVKCTSLGRAKPCDYLGRTGPGVRSPSHCTGGNVGTISQSAMLCGPDHGHHANIAGK